MSSGSPSSGPPWLPGRRFVVEGEPRDRSGFPPQVSPARLLHKRALRQVQHIQAGGPGVGSLGPPLRWRCWGPWPRAGSPTSEVGRGVLVSVSRGSSELKESISGSSELRLRRPGPEGRRQTGSEDPEGPLACPAARPAVPSGCTDRLETDRQTGRPQQLPRGSE